jgi:hypothetical protein
MCRAAGLGANRSCMAETEGELTQPDGSNDNNRHHPLVSFGRSRFYFISLILILFDKFQQLHSPSSVPTVAPALLPKSLVYYNIRRGKTWRASTGNPQKTLAFLPNVLHLRTALKEMSVYRISGTISFAIISLCVGIAPKVSLFGQTLINSLSSLPDFPLLPHTTARNRKNF